MFLGVLFPFHELNRSWSLRSMGILFILRGLYDLMKMVKQDIVVLTRTVVFDENGRVLVQHGLTSGNDFYRLPGGHVRFREKLEDYVIREVKEETGLDVEVDRLLWVRDFLDQFSDHSIELFFLATVMGGEFKSALDVESSDFFFMTVEELEEVVFYPKAFIPKLKSLRADRNLVLENPYVRSAN